MEAMNYSELVQTVLGRHTENHLSEGTEKELIFDCQRNRYLLVHVGWENEERAYGCVVHVDIKDGKIWIQRDLTEEGIANELVELGVPKTDIVLGFRSPYVRQFTGFASV
ncbi:XisI protein [Nostoc sp. 'Peltigera membranacea cyanobiont' 232]|uniref:XisI protein n=1 Tax=Nostoc sp. 'Peltigera membranacea cyanobiont' 232 TaxID=2014531 RepID=UPI000B958F1C|nr:XisI protein [Nostoc sp. 'Peltigera membranacea cyanobiont' 232]OYE03919.1 XisI protein [Nostoc sp. 'Peltigera membranacea cyanobiont' 232]